MSIEELQNLSQSHYTEEKKEIIAKMSDKEKSIISRLEYELLVVDLMGFNGYFCIVADFIQYGKKNGVPVGPGRGSAAGAILAYLSGITDIDPLRYGLLFERFLNPSRVTMPDIDVDFEHERREEVMQYIYRRYGRHRAGSAHQGRRQHHRELGHAALRLQYQAAGHHGRHRHHAHVPGAAGAQETACEPDPRQIGRAHV